MSTKKVILLFLLMSMTYLVRGQNCAVKIYKTAVDSAVFLTFDYESRTEAKIENIKWSTGQNSDRIVVTANGKYCIRLQLSNGCVAEKCIEVTEIKPNQNCIVEIIRKKDEQGNEFLCVATKGSRPVKYSWSNGDNNSCIRIPVDLKKICIGVRFDGGCFAEDCLELNDACEVKIERKVDDAGNVFFCAVGNSVYQIESFEWNTGDSASCVRQPMNLKELCVGVKFTNGCVARSCVKLEPENCAVEIVRKKDEQGNEYLCFETKGARPLRINWSNGDTNTCTRIPLDQRKICVTVKFENGCVAEDCVELNNSCEVKIVRKSDEVGGIVLCAVTNNTVKVKHYNWSTGDSSECIRVPQGTKEVCVNVTYTNGCEARSCILIEPEDCKANIVRKKDENGNPYLCVETGGPSPQVFKWSNDDSTSCIRISPDMKEACVRVLFSNGCVAEDCIKIEEICKVDIIAATNGDGIIQLCAKTESDDVRAIYWSTGDTTRCIKIDQNLREVCVKVVFANGCIASECYKVQPQDCKVEIVIRTDDLGRKSLCVETNDNPRLKIKWSTEDTVRCINYPENLKEVCVEVISEGFCVAKDCIKLGEDCRVKIERGEVTASSVVLCAVSSSDSVKYAWNTGSDDRCIKITKNGEYCVKSINADGCIATDCIKVDYFTKEDTCRFAIEKRRTDAGILLTLFTKPAGIKGLTWSTGEDTETILVTENGEYCVKAILENGCTGVACVKINAFDCGVEIIQRGKFLVARAKGKGEIHYLWSTSDTTKRIEISGLPAKVCVKITDAIGCTKETCTEIGIDGNDPIMQSLAHQFITEENEESTNGRMSSRQNLVTAVYPNPFTEYFYIDGIALNSIVQNVQVFTSNGQLVKELRFNDDDAQEHIRIDLESASPGLYLVKIKTDTEQFISKLIKY
ncbi:MAG TPA: T9SS type A sorting domain-containing protein [Saprospiraceae bacterium]|nr:T9SS type A sorting domain-containing protein [Saprospiraceae bacterium]